MTINIKKNISVVISVVERSKFVLKNKTGYRFTNNYEQIHVEYTLKKGFNDKECQEWIVMKKVAY